MRVRERHSRRLVIVSLLVAFGLGVLFGGLATRRPRVSMVAAASPEPDITGDPAPPPLLSHRQDEPDSVPGDGTAAVRDGYPIKGNGRSGIYHVPGGFAYDRTVASICFRSVEAAQAAGFRASKS